LKNILMLILKTDLLKKTAKCKFSPHLTRYFLVKDTHTHTRTMYTKSTVCKEDFRVLLKFWNFVNFCT